ncbi:bacterial transcriptional activator domain-containing protein [Streptomyces sp. NPDC003832]
MNTVPARRRQTRPRRTPTTTAVVGTALALALGPHHLALATPTPTPTNSADAGASASVDRDSPALALTDGAALAAPKILDLDLTLYGINQLVETQPARGRDSAAPPQESSTATRRPGPADGTTPAAPSASASPAPAPEARPDTSPSREAQPHASPSATPPPAAVPEPVSSERAWRSILGAGALLAALATALLALRRHSRRPRPSGSPRRWAPGQRRRHAAIPETAGMARLDAALRTLAHTAQEQGQAPPVVQAARLTGGTVQVLPHDRGLPPAHPFTTSQDGWWTLPQTTDPLGEEEDVHAVAAPFPGLVSLGTATDGALLLLNLAQMPALLLEGSPDHITEVCTSLALEAALSPWASHTEVWIVAFGDDLPHALPHQAITHLPHAGEALRELSQRLLDIHQQPPEHPQPHLLLLAPTLNPDSAQQLAHALHATDRAHTTLVAPARTTAKHFPGAPGLNASPHKRQHLPGTGTAITLQRVTPTDHHNIVQALTDTPQPGTSAATASPTPCEPQPTPTNSPADGQPNERPEDSQDVQGQNTPAHVPRQNRSRDREAPPGGTPSQDDSAFPALLAASAALTPPARPTNPNPRAHPHPPTAQSDQAPAGAPRSSPEGFIWSRPLSSARSLSAPPHGKPPSDGAQPTRASENETDPDPQAPELRVLGPVEMDRVAATGHGPRQAQLAALLYFRPGRNADTLCTDMDPDSPWSKRTLNARLQGLRRDLGHDSAGNPYVPRRNHADDPYRLSATIRCDWDQFRQLTDRALPLGPDALPDLEQALALVRGRPFGTRALPWAETHQQEMITQITAVAHAIATHRTPPGPHHNLTTARQAVATALETDDTAEALYRDWMRIEAQAGNRSGLHTALTRLQHVNQTLNCPLEPETESLIADLLHHTTSSHPAHNP